MARGSRGVRGAFDTSSELDELLSPIPAVSSSVSVTAPPFDGGAFSLREVEDGRLWSPGYAAPRTVFGVNATVGEPARSRSDYRGSKRRALSVRSYPTFESSDHVVRCVRRHQRREVMFAHGRAGRGGRMVKRWNSWSQVKC